MQTTPPAQFENYDAQVEITNTSPRCAAHRTKNRHPRQNDRRCHAPPLFGTMRWL